MQDCRIFIVLAGTVNTLQLYRDTNVKITLDIGTVLHCLAVMPYGNLIRLKEIPEQTRNQKESVPQTKTNTITRKEM